MLIASRKRYGVFALLLSLMTAALLVLGACGRGSEDDPPVNGDTNVNVGVPIDPDLDLETDPTLALGTDAIIGIPTDTAGELTVFMWSGSGSFLRDVGRVYIPAEELHGQNEAAIVATARAFNQIYPNIQINVYARIDGPNDNYIPWYQYRLNFEMEFGHFPDIFAVHDLIGDITAGVVADLTIFENDPVFRSFNPAIMELMNIGGRQWAVPQYLLPWGIFVNKSLADAHNIDIPPPNWTIDEYFRFITNHQPYEFYGVMGGMPMLLIDSSTDDIHYLLVNRGPNDPHVRLNTQPIRNLLAMMPQALGHSIWGQFNAGNLSWDFIGEHGGGWDFTPFQRGRTLTLEGSPWMMGDLAHPDPDHWGAAQMANWDIFPRPSTAYRGNHIGAVLDPMAIRNFALLDGDPNLSEYEYNRLAIAWEFVKFMNGDTRAWAARSEQLFNDGGTMAHASNDSFPFVTGAAFYEQMEYWFRGGRERFRDPARMPGFHYALEVWNRGDIVANPDKVVPWHFEFEGARRMILDEWDRKWHEENAGVPDGDPAWLDNVLARLPDWDRDANQRFEEAWAAFYAALERFYPEQVRGGR